jgi:hypothetical protein
MDFVGFGIVATFLSMLGASALAVQTQRPPSALHHHGRIIRRS